LSVPADFLGLSSLQEASLSSDPGPLGRLLLTAAEVPGFQEQLRGSFSASGSSLDTPELGNVKLSMAVFSRGEESGVMHLVMEADNPDVFRQNIRQGAGEIESAFSDPQDPMLQFIQDLKLINTQGLGDTAFGISLTMDLRTLLEGLAQAFGMPQDQLQQELQKLSAIEMEMIAFVKGSQAHIVMTFGYGQEAAEALPLAKKAAEKS
ncbi:MAG TPA: hypothetical protein VNL15_07045, partial [Dehalococcoidia bacterium]|nr:hypothetical protein [Dehalococcoidia bacterium]